MDDRDNNGPKQQKRKSTNLLTGVINFAPKVNLRKHNLGCVFMKFNFLDSFFFPLQESVQMMIKVKSFTPTRYQANQKAISCHYKTSCLKMSSLISLAVRLQCSTLLENTEKQNCVPGVLSRIHSNSVYC